MGEWVEAGEQAPDFTLPADDGTQVTLSELRGQPVVIYFYPKDNTPGCTKQACNFRDLKDQFADFGVRILGISPDNAASHNKFRDKHRLNFTLLCDTDYKVADRYGAWREKLLFGIKRLGIRRSTFLIDASGQIAKVWKSVKVAGHDQQVLEAIQQLNGKKS